MKLYFSKEKKQGGVLFEASEMKFFHSVILWLKAHFTSSANTEMIIRQVSELMNEQPHKRLTYTRTHICQKCCRIMVEGKDSLYVHAEDGDIAYRHQVCPPTNYKEVSWKKS